MKEKRRNFEVSDKARKEIRALAEFDDKKYLAEKEMNNTCSDESNISNFCLDDLLECKKLLEDLPPPIIGLTVSYLFWGTLQNLEEFKSLKENRIFFGLLYGQIPIYPLTKQKEDFKVFYDREDLKKELEKK